MVEIDATKDYYHILGVSIDASVPEIRKIYRELAKRYHPDTGHGDTEAFRLATEAYRVLSNPRYRESYDRQRGLAEDGSNILSLALLQSRARMPPMETRQMFYVIVDLQVVAKRSSLRQAMNLALVIDCSTSMQGERLRNVKRAALTLVDGLHAEDRLAVVAFSDRAEVIAPSSLIGDGKRQLRSAIASLIAGGGTELYQGLAAGIEQVRAYASAGAISHVVLLTDGRTYGDEALILAAAARAREQGIGVSAFGIGEDWNDVFLDEVVRRGGGVSHYIDTPTEIEEALRAEVMGLSRTVLRNVRVQLNAAPYVSLASAYRVAPYMEMLPIAEGNVCVLGALSYGQLSTLALELTIGQNAPGSRRIARLLVEGEDVAGRRRVRSRADIRVTFQEGAGDEPIPSRLLDVMARLTAFRLQERAWRALENGEPERATRYLESAATRLFDLGYRELGQAAMIEMHRISQGAPPSPRGKKRLRYGTRFLPGTGG